MSFANESANLWLENAARYPLLPQQEVIRLAHIIQDPETSPAKRKRTVNKLVKHNLLLIPIIVRRCLSSKRSYKYMDQSTEDFFQCATIGLNRAAELYDPKRGYTFSTYAASWIFQAVQREIYNNVSMVRVPENTLREVYKVYGEGCRDFNELDSAKRERYTSAVLALNCMSLDAKLPSDDSSHLDMLADSSHKEYDVIDVWIQRAGLSEIQKAIIVYKYEDDLTENQVAERLGVTRQFVNSEIRTARRRLKTILS